MRSGCWAGHRLVIGKEDKSVIDILFFANQLAGLCRRVTKCRRSRLLTAQCSLQGKVEHRPNLGKVVHLERTGGYGGLLSVDRHKVTPTATHFRTGIAR